MYKLEKFLVDDFKDNICQSDNAFDISEFAFEFYFNNGRVDVIGHTVEGKLIAFEAKLTKWRTAVNQAYRNTSFAHYSYVLIPANIVDKAIKHRREFDRRGLGLCSISPEGIKIEISAPQKNPILPWLTESAIDYIAMEKYDRKDCIQKDC